jgi:hypothetical protein
LVLQVDRCLATVATQYSRIREVFGSSVGQDPAILTCDVFYSFLLSRQEI